jgi:hypothetical protein
MVRVLFFIKRIKGNVRLIVGEDNGTYVVTFIWDGETEMGSQLNPCSTSIVTSMVLEDVPVGTASVGATVQTTVTIGKIMGVIVTGKHINVT